MTVLKFLGAGSMVVEPGWSAKRHSHPISELMVIHGGALVVEIGGRQVRAAAGDVLLYPPQAAHEEHGEGRERLDFAYIAFEGGAPSSAVLAHDHDGRVRQLVAWLLAEQPAGQRDLLDAITAVLVAEFRRISAPRDATLATAMREFLAKRLADHLSVEDLARAAHMSRAHFIRTYKRETGRTPMQELRVMRVAAARDLIMSTGLPLKAVASKVGLGDEFHLSHVFRRELGVPPGYFRRGR